MRNIHIFALLAIGVLLAGLAWAEEITITSYYPSPYGVYRDLETKKSHAVGDIGSGSGTAGINKVGDLAQGELWVEKGVIFKPQAADPAAAKKGELIYNSTEDTFKHFNGSAWVTQAGYCYTYYSNSMASCDCPAGETKRKDLGSWGYCYYLDDCIPHNTFDTFRPPGLSCLDIMMQSGGLNRDRGLACVCCGE
ncbi:MAG: hypothetical protein V1662_06310 [Candidatus Omnitrophota bacterium]